VIGRNSHAVFAFHLPQISTQKLNVKAQSKVGSMDNVKHRPGGGDKKIFDDKEYLKQIEHPMAPTTPPAQVNCEP
jgi:microtubule-associated protein tau